MQTILTLQDIEYARAMYAAGFWTGDTFYTLLRTHAKKAPERFAIRDANSRLTFRQLLERVDHLAMELHGAGLRPGDRVSLWMASRTDVAIAFIACSRMGYACNCSLHRDYTCDEVVALIRRVGAAALIVERKYGADSDKRDIVEMLRGHPGLKRVLTLEPLSEGGETEVSPTAHEVTELDLPIKTSPDRLTYLAFTSGSTGVPKGVMHTDNTLLSNARAVVKDWNFDASTVVYSISPLSHNIGIVGLSIALAAGGEFICHSPIDARRLLDRIVETGATFLLGVPTHGMDLVAGCRQRGLTTLGAVNTFQVGGAPVPPALVRNLRSLSVRIMNCFGMTENCCVHYTRPDDDETTITETCGRAGAGYETSLWREDDPDLPADVGQIGELAVRGPGLMLGYFDNQDATEKAFNRSGWFMTGDLARFDAKGNMQIVGRKKDVIIRGGHNIYPARIENLALRHPNVAKVAVFPVADERLSEKVCLCVILRSKAGTTGAELLAHLYQAGLSKYDMPEYFVEVDAFPLMASGKIYKRGLVQSVSDGALVPAAIRWTAPAEKHGG